MSGGFALSGILIVVIAVVVIGVIAAALLHAFSTNKNRDDDK